MSKFMSVLEKMRVVEKVNGENPDGTSLDAVSYTHLDVYKRQ